VGQLRVVGSTTHEEFKQIERDRALARRLQKIVVDEPSVETRCAFCRASDRGTGAPQRPLYRRGARAATRLAKRHLRDHRLPDAAIDLLDEAGASLRLKAAAAPPPAPRARPRPRPLRRRPSTSPTSSASWPGWRAFPRAGSATERGRLRGLEEALRRVVFGQEDAVRQVAGAIKRSRAGLGLPIAPPAAFFHGADGCWQDRAGAAAGPPPRNEFIRFDMSEYMEKHTVARLTARHSG